MSRKPIFDQASLEKIRAAQAAASNDVIETRDTDWVLLVTRDRSDILIPQGTRLVARRQDEPGDAALVIVVIDGEHVLRRTPVTEGRFVGVVVGVVVEVPDAD